MIKLQYSVEQEVKVIIVAEICFFGIVLSQSKTTYCNIPHVLVAI